MRRFVRSRWSLAALAGGTLLASALAFVPSRADAQPSSAGCTTAGLIYCYRIELAQGPGGLEVRAYAPILGFTDWWQ